jgi:phosphoribosylanthranilate isomerase
MPTLTKICGFTREADLQDAIDLGVSMVGFNFYPGSKRYIPDDVALRLRGIVPSSVLVVGLYVSEDAEEIQQHAKKLRLDAVQIYSKTNFTLPLPTIRAFRVRDASDLDLIRAAVAASRPWAVLLDAYVEGELGGTGHRAPWELLVNFHPGVPVMLAGGLTPENVSEAVKLVKPWAVDTASGVESAPGIKSMALMKGFIENSRYDAETCLEDS